MEIIKNILNADQYLKKETKKSQIVLHHTVSNGNADNVINWWNTNTERVATHFVIGGDGKIHQALEMKYYAYHLGLKDKRNEILNQQSIGIEICNWGAILPDTDGKYYPLIWDNNLKKYVPYHKYGVVTDIVKYENKFRTFNYFQKYNDAQIQSLKELLVYLTNTHSIAKDYNEAMWDYSEDAMNGHNGIWTHVSYRKDKSDCHPQTELVDMLKDLKNN